MPKNLGATGSQANAKKLFVLEFFQLLKCATTHNWFSCLKTFAFPQENEPCAILWFTK